MPNCWRKDILKAAWGREPWYLVPYPTNFQLPRLEVLVVPKPCRAPGRFQKEALPLIRMCHGVVGGGLSALARLPSNIFHFRHGTVSSPGSLGRISLNHSTMAIRWA